MLKQLIIVSSLMFGCAVDPADEPAGSGSGEQPIPMTVNIDWSSSGFDVNELNVKLFPLTGEGRVAVQLVLDGTVTGPSGSTLKIMVNNGRNGWEADGLNSLDYASASCGSWQV